MPVLMKLLRIIISEIYDEQFIFLRKSKVTDSFRS